MSGGFYTELPSNIPFWLFLNIREDHLNEEESSRADLKKRKVSIGVFPVSWTGEFLASDSGVQQEASLECKLRAAHCEDTVRETGKQYGQKAMHSI